LNYYERHLGDYARDTAHLSMLEHGAYNLLLDRYYASEQPIPADQAHRVARARSAEERKAVDAVLAEFFTLEEGGFRQKRVQAEIERAHHRIETARNNGRTGGRPKKNPAGFGSHIPKQTEQKPGGFPVGLKTETGSKALQTPDSNHQTPEEDSLRSPSSAQEPNETQRVLVPRETSEPSLAVHARWRAHHDWFLEAIRPAYPSNLHTDADWQFAARLGAAILDTGQCSRERLLQLTIDFAAQQDAKQNRDTQFVESPAKHFDGKGKWKGPFNLPKDPQRATTAQKFDDELDRWAAGKGVVRG
jgi:uncharacterized protein YdaU (DUF1376 family)